jgi:hypothetical protein
VQLFSFILLTSADSSSICVDLGFGGLGFCWLVSFDPLFLVDLNKTNFIHFKHIHEGLCFKLVVHSCHYSPCG